MKYLFFLFSVFFVACSSTEKDGGIVITFDDQSIEEWAVNRDLFKQYNIKAIFFITRPFRLTEDEINALLLLQDDGHEIACHGMNHKSVLHYEDSLLVYIEEEVLPAISWFSEKGFIVQSFAYPFGEATQESDSFLNPYFKVLRKATYDYKNAFLDEYDEIFVKKDKSSFVNAMGIDKNYNISFESLKRGIKRAKKQNECLILYAHIIDNSGENYSVTPQYLKELFELCEKHRLSSYTISEIYSLNER